MHDKNVYMHIEVESGKHACGKHACGFLFTNLKSVFKKIKLFYNLKNKGRSSWAWTYVIFLLGIIDAQRIIPIKFSWHL